MAIFLVFFCSGKRATLNLRSLMNASSDHFLPMSRLDFAMQMQRQAAGKKKEEKFQPAVIE